MSRRPLTRAKRVRIWNAANGICHICKLPIDGTKDKWDAEHIKPIWLGGADDESNMAPAHKRCHAPKTAQEAAPRAKSNRIRARHMGIRKTQPRPIPGTKASGWRHRMDGTWERR